MEFALTDYRKGASVLCEKGLGMIIERCARQKTGRLSEMCDMAGALIVRWSSEMRETDTLFEMYRSLVIGKSKRICALVIGSISGGMCTDQRNPHC